MPVAFQVPGLALSVWPSCAGPPPAGGVTLGRTLIVAGPSSETRKNAEGMKYSLVELKFSDAVVWLLASAARLGKASRSIPSWLA